MPGTTHIIWDDRIPRYSELAQRDYIMTIHQKLLEAQASPRVERSYFSWQEELTTEDRKILVNWLIIVQVEFKLAPETIQCTVDLIDRFLERSKIKILEFQLLGITAMFIACKLHELYPPVISDFIQVTKNSFTKQ